MSTDWTPDRVRSLRKRLEKTQKDFGEMVGVHVVTVIRWESGSSKPSQMAIKVLDKYERS